MQMNVSTLSYGRDVLKLFVGKLKLHGAVASPVASFNEGACHMSQVLQKLFV